MFTNYDEEFNAQTSALESLLNELDDEMAMEGLFSKPKSADQMLDKVKKNISKKCKTVEDCDDMLAKLKNEEEKFNSALKTMKDAAVQFKNGEIDKKELKNIVKPAAAELKKTCNIISLKDINADTNNVTDEEIQKLHDFLVGTREAINERKKELSSEGNDDTAEESLVGGYLGYLDDDMVDAATEAVQTAEIAMEGALETLRNAVIKFCESCASKCLTKAMAARKDGDDKKKATWEKWANVFRGIADKCKKANSEAEVKAQEKHAKKVQEDIEKAANKMASGKGNSMHSATKESFTFENDPYLRMLEAASEAYDLAKADYELAMESLMYSTDDDDAELEPATEAAEDAVAAGAVVVSYAALIALCAKAYFGGSEGSESKYIKMLNKEVKPKLKEAKKKIKQGKKSGNYDMAIAGCNEVIAINEKIKKSVEELGRDIKVSTTKNSDGTSSEKIEKAFGTKADETLSKAADEIDKMKADIKIFEMKKKKANGNSADDAVTEAFIAGYTRALAALEEDDDIAAESTFGVSGEEAHSFLEELL